MNVLIQVNLAGETQKGGVAASAVEALAAEIRTLPRLRLRGLMTIPPAGMTEDESRSHFRAVAALAKRLSDADRTPDVLSMGMSGDFETAIECGSTCVRVGTALFGPRRTAG